MAIAGDTAGKTTSPSIRTEDDGAEDEEDEEEVYVRGFAGNAIRTEKGVQHLGK